MHTRNESASSPPAKRHGALRECLIAVANTLVVAAGMYSAYSLAVSHYESKGGETPTRVALYRADAIAVDANACLHSVRGTPVRAIDRLPLSSTRSD